MNNNSVMYLQGINFVQSQVVIENIINFDDKVIDKFAFCKEREWAFLYH